MEFWNIFFNLCTNKGESPNAVAKKLNISSASVTWWKQGQRNPSARTIKKIADYFGVPVGFFTGCETPEVKDRAEKAREQMNSLRTMHYVPPRIAKNAHIELKTTESGQKENALEYTEGERLLLDLFRSLPAERQELFLQMVKAFAEAQKQG